MDMSPGLLMADGARTARRRYVRAAAASLVSCGSVLWAYGLVEEHSRRALAVAMQTGGSLASGACDLLEAGNAYAASALVRQLIEVEYLLWLFGNEPTTATAWLTAQGEKARAQFRPTELRKRAGGWFAAPEYRSHCEVGGHPHPRGHSLLPDRFVGRPEDEACRDELLWLDLAVHLDRLWREFDRARHALGLLHVVVAREAADAMRGITAAWLAADVLGRNAVEGIERAARERVAPAA